MTPNQQGPPTNADRTDTTAPALDLLLLEQFQEFEQSFRRRLPLVWWITLVGPFLLSAVVVAVVFAVGGAEQGWRLIGAATASVFFFGRFIILSGRDPQVQEVTRHLTTEQLFLLVTYLDVVVAAFLAFHVGWLFKLPKIGARIRDLVVDGQFFLRMYPAVKRATFVGLMVFVSFPLSATGSVGGAIFGRLLGMGRFATFVGTVLGGMLGNGIMYFGSDILGAWLDKDHPVVQYGGLAVIALLILFLEYRYRSLKRRTAAAGSALTKQQSDAETSTGSKRHERQLQDGPRP